MKNNEQRSTYLDPYAGGHPGCVTSFSTVGAPKSFQSLRLSLSMLMHTNRQNCGQKFKLRAKHNDGK